MEKTKNEMSSNVQEAKKSSPSCKILFFFWVFPLKWQAFIDLNVCCGA